MNPLVLNMKKCHKAMHSYVLVLYEIILESDAELILEIGVGTKAQSTRTILSALQENNKGKLISIDDSSGNRGIDGGIAEYWKLIVGDSHHERIYNQVKDKKFDILFIDGDHSYAGCKKDFEMYSPLVKDRGLILMHDITNAHEGVPKFWKEIKYPKIALEYGIVKRSIVPGFGIVQMIR